MIPNPIRRVLSSIREHRVRALLMGGQACVWYGAAEFSRDTDLLILADAGNLTRLRQALTELGAKVIGGAALFMLQGLSACACATALEQCFSVSRCSQSSGTRHTAVSTQPTLDSSIVAKRGRIQVGIFR